MAFEYTSDPSSSSPETTDDGSLTSTLNRYLLSDEYINGGDYKTTASDAFLDWTSNEEADPEKKLQVKVPRKNDAGVLEDVDKEAPMFRSGGLTPDGKEHFSRAKEYLEVAASLPDGGVRRNPDTRKWEVNPALEQILTQKREKQPDLFKNYDKAKEQIQSIDIEGKTPEMTYSAYVDFHNADIPENSPARMDKDNERMKAMFDQQKEMREFDPAKMDQNAYVWDVAGRKIPNLKKLNDMPGLLAAIDEQDMSAADKKMMKINLRDSVNQTDSKFITEAADAEAFAFEAKKGGVLAPILNFVGGEVKNLVGIDRQDIHSKFTRHMDKPDGDMYSFIEQNPDLFNKDQYGMLDKLNNAFWGANRSTGAGAMLLAAAPFGGNDTITKYAADSAAVGDNAFEGMGGTEHYKVLGMDFTNKGFYDLAGQVGSMIITFGAGTALKGGIKAAGAVAAAKAAPGVVGKAAIAGRGAIVASEETMKRAMTQLAPNTLKNIGIKAIKDPSAYIGALQAGGMSFGSTYNQVLDQTGDPEKAYEQAGMKGLADGLSAFIATAAFNRIAPGLEKGMSGVEGGMSGSIFKHLKMNKALKSAASQDAQKAAIETIEGLAAEGSELRKALAPALRETINRAARANGLKGYGPVAGIVAESAEEFTDTALSDVFLAVMDDSKTWKGEVWDNIESKFSEYMSAAVMGAFGGGLGESGGMVIEAAGAFRKKNQETRVREIKEFSEVIWKDIKENNSDASAEMLGIKAASGAPVVSVAKYMVDESIPVEKRAKVLAQHAVSGFARRLEPSATTPVERAEKAAEKAKTAPLDPMVVSKQEMSDHLGDPPKDSAGKDMEWNPEIREPTRDVTHNFSVGDATFTMKSVAVKGETSVGAVLTNAKGESKMLTPSEAAEQLKAANPISPLFALGKDASARKEMLRSFGKFNPSQTTNYARPVQSTTDSGANPKVPTPSKEGVGNPPSAKGDGGGKAPGDGNAVKASGAGPVASSEGIEDDVEDEIDLTPAAPKVSQAKPAPAAAGVVAETTPAAKQPSVEPPLKEETNKPTNNEKQTNQNNQTSPQGEGLLTPTKRVIHGILPKDDNAGTAEALEGLDEDVVVAVADSEEEARELYGLPADARVMVLSKKDSNNAADISKAVRAFKKRPSSLVAPAVLEEKLSQPTVSESSSDSGSTLIENFTQEQKETQEKEEVLLAELPDSSTIEQLREVAPQTVDTALVAALKSNSKQEFLDWLKKFSKELTRFGDKLWTSAKIILVTLVGINVTNNSTKKEVASVVEISPKIQELEIIGSSIIQSSLDEFESMEFNKAPFNLPLQEQNNVAALDIASMPQPAIVSIDVPAPLVEVAPPKVTSSSFLEATDEFLVDNDAGNSAVVIPADLAKQWLEQGTSPAVNAGAALLNENEASSSRIKKMLVSLGINESPSTFPWCTAFTSWAVSQGGNRVKTLSARAFLNLGKKTKSPSYGDVAVLWNDNPDTGGRSGWGGHTGLVLGETDSHVILLSGNSSDSVNVAAFPKARVLGYRTFSSSVAALNAQPDTANDKPQDEDPLFIDPSIPKFYANPVMDVEDEFGGIWSVDDKSQLYYKPAKGKTLPIGVNAVVEIEGKPDQILVLTEEADGFYYFRSVDVKTIGEAMRNDDKTTLGKLNSNWNRNRLTKAGEFIEPMLKELLGGKGPIDPAAFKSMIEQVLQVVAPGSNPAMIKWDAEMTGGSFFNVKRDGDKLSMELDQKAFIKNLRSVFKGYNAARNSKLYDSFVANEVARQIAAFVDEEQTHFVAMQEFTDEEIINSFDDFVDLMEDVDKNGNVKQQFVTDLFNRIAKQRVKGKEIKDFDDSDKYLVASETLRALNQILTSGVSTEQQTTDSKRLLIALNEDFERKDTNNPWKTIVELLKRYMQKIKRMAHLRYMMGQLPSSLNRMIRQQETAYVKANLRGDVDQIKSKGLEEAVERFQRSRAMTKKAIGDVAMKNNEVLVDVRAIAQKLGMSLDDMVVLDYKAGTIRLRTSDDEDGVDVRYMIDKYYPGTDIEELDKALADLNEEGALSLVQRDLGYAWNQLEWARANTPNFLSVLEEGGNSDQRIQEDNPQKHAQKSKELRRAEQLKVWSQLVASAPAMDNGSLFIKKKEAELEAMVKADRIKLNNINVDILDALAELDPSKVADSIKASKIALALGYDVDMGDSKLIDKFDPITKTRELVEAPRTTAEKWLTGLGLHAFNLATDSDALMEGKTPLIASNALLPAHSILFPNQPTNFNNTKRLQLQDDLAAFKLAVMTEEQQERIGRANLTPEEQESLARLKTAKEIEMYASGEGRSSASQILLKARRLRQEAAINKPFAEEEMTKFNDYMKALDLYNETNRRVVDLVLGSESLDNTNFGLRFQNLSYAKFEARDVDEAEAYVKSKMAGRNQFFDSEQGLDHITPTTDKEAGYGINYYSAVFQEAQKEGADRLRYHVDRPGVPFFVEMVPSADGMTMVEKPYDKSKVFTLERNASGQTILLNRHVGSNMAAIGTNYQMQWQKMLTDIGVNESLAQRYEGTYGFNSAPIENDDINATKYEEIDFILPNLQYGKFFIDFLNSKTKFAKLDQTSFFRDSGIPKMIETSDGGSARVNPAKIGSTEEYDKDTFANYFQNLRNWATKLKESTDPTKILPNIGEMQTLAGRLSSRIHERASEALKLIDQQERLYLDLHFDVASSSLSGKALAERLAGIYGGKEHRVLQASVLSLKNEARWARGAVNRFIRSRPNVTREVTQTSRDAGMVAYSDFFEDARKGFIDYPTLHNTLFNINYFSKSKTSAVGATFGIDLYEKFRRISFSKEDGELVVGGPNWVWSKVPVFERDKKGNVVFEEMFEKRGIGENGQEFTELISSDSEDYVQGMPAATMFKTEMVNGVEMRRSVQVTSPKVKRNADGSVMTARKQIHVNMDPTEAIAYAIADKDNSGHFPLSSDMGTQGNTVQESLQGRSSEDSKRSRAQRAQVTMDLQRQLQNKRLTEAALLIGLNLDDSLPIGDARADGPREFLRELVALEENPQGRDAFVRKAMKGLFSGSTEAEITGIVDDFESYLISQGLTEKDIIEPYLYHEGEALGTESKYQQEAERIRVKGMSLMRDILASIRTLEVDADGKLQKYTREEYAKADKIFNALPETMRMKKELSDAIVKAGLAAMYAKTGAGTRYRNVKKMVNVPAESKAAGFERSIDPFEFIESIIEYKAKLEMEVIDSARVADANGNGNDANKELLSAIRTTVGYALSAGDNNEIKSSFAATASKMTELGMGDLFAPRKGNGFASNEEARKIALMLQDESRGDKAINLHRGNVFTQYNETGFVSANKAVNLLTQNIPGILVYRASKNEIDKNQAYFGSRFLPGVDGNPPVLYAAEGSNSADNEAMVVQALVWWATQSESAALVAPVLQDAAERVRAALSPITHVERFMRAHKGNGIAITEMLDKHAMSLLEQNPQKLEAMDAAAKEAEAKILSGLLRDHFRIMENLHALARDSELDRAVDVSRVDLSGLDNSKGLISDALLIAQAMTNPNMKKLLDRFLFGDNLLKSSNLTNATLNKILLANKQMGEDAVEERDPYAFDNALETKSAPKDEDLAEEEQGEEIETSFRQMELDRVFKMREDTTEREEKELDIEPSSEDKEFFNTLEPTAASVLQFLRNWNHDVKQYGLMDERMEAVLEEFHRGRAGVEDPAWNGESLPASDAMMINLFVDLIGLAKDHSSMRFDATTQMEGMAASRATPGSQLLKESTSPQARPIVRQNTVSGLRRTQESNLPGREGVPVVTAWHNMMDGRINGRTATTLYHESNRFKSFAGGLLSRVSGVESVIRKEVGRSIDQGTQAWVDAGSKPDGLVIYPRAFADMALTPELFQDMKKSFPMLEEHEAEARKELKAMQDRKSFIEQRIAFNQEAIARVEARIAEEPKMFDEQTIEDFDDSQREIIVEHVSREADRFFRAQQKANLDPSRSNYQLLLNQAIAFKSLNGERRGLTMLFEAMTAKFNSLERNPTSPTNQNTRDLLNEMNLPLSLKIELGEKSKAMTIKEKETLRVARQNIEVATKELAGMVRLNRNPAKGGFFQRLAHNSVTPWSPGRHTFTTGEKGPTGRNESVNSTMVFYPSGTVSNFENKMAIEDGLAQVRSKWNASEDKNYEFYIMKEALTKSLGQYARHADELYRAVKGDQAYFNDYNPAAIIRQVTDTLTLQEKVAEARLAEFKANRDSLTGMGGMMSQLSPDAIALLAEPGVHSIYSTTNVVKALEVRDKLQSLLIDPEKNNREIIKLQNDLVRLNAERRVSKYKVPTNFEARKDIIGHLINNGEWVMLGQINAEQDLKNRFYSETELTAAEKTARRKMKKVTMKDIVLNSLPDTDEPTIQPQTKNRMGFTRAWKDEAWAHSFAAKDFTTTGTTREQIAKEYAERHASLLIQRANTRPADKVLHFRLAAEKKVDANHVDVKNALSQLSHMVEALVLAYDKLAPSTEPDGRGLKEDVKKFLEMMNDESIGMSDSTAQQVRLFELFERVSARIEGEATLNELLTGLSTNLSTAELTAMKMLHHHDARVRIRYRKNYLAQLEAMRLHGILQKGFDMNSGRNGWISQLEAEKKVMAEKHIALGNDSLQHSIPYMIASLKGLLNVRTNSVAANFSMWSSDLKKGVTDIALYHDAQMASHSKTTDGLLKKAAGGVKGFFNDDHVNVMRDEKMVKELYALIEDIVDSPLVPKKNKEAYAVEQINKAIERLYAKSEEAGVKDAAIDYVDYIGKKFKGMTDAAEIMMMAMGHDQKDAEDINPSEAFLAGRLHGQARLISTVPLRYAYATDPSAERLSLEVTPYKSDPLHEVGFQEMSLLGGPGRTEKRDKNKKTLVYRPVSLNGISAIEGMMDDTLYRLNVTPVYSSLRNIVGSVQQAGPNQAEIVNSLILGEDEQDKDKRLQRVALAGIASEFDNEIANDMQHGVTDTAFAESIQFLSSMYIFKALFSFQQWWNQSAPSLLGYGAKKLASGKWNEAGMMFEAIGQILSSKSFDKNEAGNYNHDAKAFMLHVAPWSSFRGADGMDPVKTNLRNQVRHGVGNVKKFSGKAAKVAQEWQEKGLDLAIARPERLLSRAIFLTELMAELQWMKSRDLIDGDIPTSISEMINPENKGRFDIPQEAVEAAQTKLNDHMGVSDKAKKSFFFQNKTSSPTWNALMRSIVRFSNHQASTSSNMSALAPTLWQAQRHATGAVNEAGEDVGGQLTEGGKRAHQNAVENIVGTMVQNSLFHALKIRNLVPILLSVGYMLGGDDEDEAIAKAQEQTDKLFNADDEDNAVVGGMKAMLIGKPGQFFQDWKDSDAAAASAYAGLGSSMISEMIPVAPVAGAALGLFPVASAFKAAVTNSVVQDVTAALTGLKSAENKWDKEAVYVYERENGGVQTAMQLTAPTGVLYDLISGFKLSYDANETGEVNAFDLSMYLAQEILFSTREGRQTSKKVLQEAVWANE